MRGGARFTLPILIVFRHDVSGCDRLDMDIYVCYAILLSIVRPKCPVVVRLGDKKVKLSGQFEFVVPADISERNIQNSIIVFTMHPISLNN